MSTATREHLAGLDIAIDRWNAAPNVAAFLAQLREAHAQASAAPEQEAVAYGDPKAFKNMRIDGHKGAPYNREWMWAQPAPGLVPLYTHPSAEIERMQAELELWKLRSGGNLYAAQVMEGLADEQEDELVTVRHKLAEAQALLRDFADCPWVVEEATVPKAGMNAAPNQVVGTMHVSLARLRKVRAFLSTTAQPAEDQTNE